MTKAEEIEQSWKLFEELCRQRKERLDKLERDINEAQQRYGITNNEATDKHLSDTGNGHSCRDDVSRVQVEKQVLHTRASQPTEGGR